jgi:hypothetical protein
VPVLGRQTSPMSSAASSRRFTVLDISVESPSPIYHGPVRYEPWPRPPTGPEWLESARTIEAAVLELEGVDLVRDARHGRLWVRA